MSGLRIPAERRLGVVTDEIDRDLRMAVRRALDWGIRRVDVRAVGSHRIPDLDDDGLNALQETVDHVDIASLSPGFFKGAMSGRAVRDEIDRGLPRTLALAGRLGVPQVIVFGGGRGQPRADSLAVLRDARETAADAGVELVVENSALCSVARAGDLLDVAEAVGVRVAWDPGNAVAAGSADPVADSRAVARLAACTHLRDRDAVGWCRLDEGLIDWRAIVGTLEAAGFTERYVVETHLPDDPGATEWNVRTLAECLRRVDASSEEA